MLIRTPPCGSRSVKATLVNGAPGSVVKISGRPRGQAWSNASRQHAMSMVIEMAQDHTYRLHPSITATQDTKPEAKRIEVLAALQT